MAPQRVPLRGYPSLYQVNTRVRLNELGRIAGRRATLDDFPDGELGLIAAKGFQWIWMLGVWQTGPAGRAVSLSHKEWLDEYRQVLPDVSEADITGSPFAITNYSANQDFGGDDALRRFRDRVHKAGLKLMLDFVPNHTAQDHPWVKGWPEFYVQGSEDLLAKQPQNYKRVETSKGNIVLAYGRDPYFPGWPDTFQLNYGNPALREAMAGELKKIAGLSDGVRCDMAMLILPDVFKKTWGIPSAPFWPPVIHEIKQSNPGFTFMAEVYWDLEHVLQQEGFDFTYDKRLYDRLRAQTARPVRDHLRAELAFQEKSARFLENHDEPRAASVFAPDVHRAAAIITFFSPGLRFFHMGQWDGSRKKIPVHLGRGPVEPINGQLQGFYYRLLDTLHEPIFHTGSWSMLECKPASEGNWSWDSFLVFWWEGGEGKRALVAVNYSPHQSQGFVKLPFEELRAKNVRFRDWMGSATYERDGSDLVGRGLYLDMPAWGFHVFDVKAR